MTQRVNFSILFCTISILTAQAQWNKQDSIRLQELLNGDGELKINTEAVKSIHFDFQSDKVNPEKPDVPLNKNDAFQKVQKRRVQKKR